MTRTDVHRPSAIDPADYEFVGCEMVRTEGDIMGACAIQQAERAIIRAHMERTGGTYSQHAHGGNCHVCGNANAIYTVLFHHEPTNTYIRVGSDCADKLECGDPAMFRRLTKLRDGLAAMRKNHAGKMKAEAILTDAGLARAWAIYTAERQDSDGREEEIVRDIVGKIVKYGDPSEKQLNFVRKLVLDIDQRPAREAARKAEADAAAPVPAGEARRMVTGEVLTIKSRDFGGPAMLLKHPDGYRLWGSVPGNLCGEIDRGDVVEFSATVKASDRDPKFGFFSRPTKARKVA